MTAYVLAQISIHDRERYQRYVAGFAPILQKYEGRLLAADEAPTVLEGRSDREKVVLMSFPDAEAARRFHESPDYRRIAVDRNAGADAVVLLVKGFAAK